jgi:hypothetical protein
MGIPAGKNESDCVSYIHEYRRNNANIYLGCDVTAYVRQ